MSRIEDEPAGERTPLLQSPTPRELTESCNMSARSWRDTSSFLARQSYYSTLSTQLSQSGTRIFYSNHFTSGVLFVFNKTFCKFISNCSSWTSYTCTKCILKFIQWALYRKKVKNKNPLERPFPNRTATRTSTIPRSSHCDKGSATRFPGSNSFTWNFFVKVSLHFQINVLYQHSVILCQFWRYFFCLDNTYHFKVKKK